MLDADGKTKKNIFYQSLNYSPVIMMKKVLFVMYRVFFPWLPGALVSIYYTPVGTTHQLDNN